MKPFLIEIGSEEVPARFISKGLELLREGLLNLFEEHSIDFGNISEYATPRRLSIYIDEIAEKQKDTIVESLGPPRKIAFDSHGNPTKAAIGFAKSLNIDVGSLQIKETDRGEYIAATVEKKGEATKTVLSNVLPDLISSLQIPKSMRWGSGSLRYFRPIKWILSLIGSEVISFDLEGIKSSNITYGHRFLSPVAIKIGDPSSYLPLLKQNHVIADQELRKRSIMEGIKTVESSTGCKAREDDELLDIVTNLVEYPAVVSGSYDEKFISLPKELLITVMKSHQKYFSLEDHDGNMVPSFIVVSNTNSENNDTVRRGAERVLRARLEDARFYYLEDQKKVLGEHVEELKKVTFQEKLGSIYEKAERISVLCSFLSETLKLENRDKLERAAMLCKADLVTGVVGEFPELQGYMGMIYALNANEDKDVATAIHEHYLPKFAGDILPSSITGAVLSIADKIDTIASFFYLDKIPTGSEDPFALRRQAVGIINILQSRDMPLSLNNLVDKALQCLEASEQERNIITGKILQFFGQRLEGIFLSLGYSHDIINAVLSREEMYIADITNRIKVLTELKKEAGFPSLLTAAKRAYNILSKAQPGTVKEDLLTEPTEKELFSVLGTVKGRLIKGDHKACYELEAPINSFFDSVLVMDKDPEIKNNRLALLFSVKDSFDMLGDFSKLV